jgi:hypothetical protein
VSTVAPLRFVAGHGVAVVEVPVHPRHRDGDAPLVIREKSQGLVLWINGGDDSACAVEQPEPVIVSDHQDVVASSVLALPAARADGHRVQPEPAGGEEPGAGRVVELGDIGRPHG